jgi:hypothetical protein
MTQDEKDDSITTHSVLLDKYEYKLIADPTPFECQHSESVPKRNRVLVQTARAVIRENNFLW